MEFAQKGGSHSRLTFGVKPSEHAEGCLRAAHSRGLEGSSMCRAEWFYHGNSDVLLGPAMLTCYVVSAS